jgi:hypothetical protein
MRLLTLLLLSFSLNIFAGEKKQIIFLTDSHGLSIFGEVVDATLRNIQESAFGVGHTIQQKENLDLLEAWIKQENNL